MKLSDHLYYAILRYLTWCGMICWGGNPFDKGDEPPAPDYTPVANASADSTAAMKEMAANQLAESKRQYDQNVEIARPVVDQQLELMRQSKAQGDDYYDYMITRQRPVEDRLNAEAMSAGSEAEQEAAAGRAVADVRQGTTAATNQMIRQALRHGYSPAKLAEMAKRTAGQQGLAEATAANAGRLREKDTGYAKRMDVAGLYRGLPGASQGAYGLANASGASAVNTQMAPGQNYVAGMNTAASTTGAGLQMALNGRSTILNNQSSLFTAGQANAQSGMNAGLGAVGTVLGNINWSDRRMKENIELVGQDEATGLDLYEFNYIGDRTRFRGVMADEVEPRFPDAVAHDDLGFASVNYHALGLKMERV